jgi:thiol-disulfide isomerase/thioredoxin/protocatechuate 3,4-dioxygenase beta subunit
MTLNVTTKSAGLMVVVGILVSMARGAEDAAKNTRGEITVHAVDGSGAPQANATVELFKFDRDWRYWKKAVREFRCDSKGTATCGELADESANIIRVTAGHNRFAYREFTLTEETPQQEATLQVEPQAAMSIRVHDEKGNAIEGARIWQIDHSGRNGSIRIDWRSISEFGLTASASTADGELHLPALPPGKFGIRVVHPDFAPTELKDIEVVKKAAARVEMKRGVKLTLRLDMAGDERSPDAVMIDCRHEKFENPSTLIGQLLAIRGTNRVEVTVSPGEYEQIRLTHPQYTITPYYLERYGHGLADHRELIDIREGSNVFGFKLSPKVKVHGRVTNLETGQPVVGESIQGSLHVERKSGSTGRFADEWSHIGWGDTDKNGDYELSLAAGRARVSFQGRGLVAIPDHFNLDVAANGRTMVPEFKVRPMPKVRGIVLDENGKPKAKAIVRFRSSVLIFAMQPVATDENGRFELAPPFIPEDLQTHEKLGKQKVLAFDPYHLLSAQAEIVLDDPNNNGEVVLALKPQTTELLSSEVFDDLPEWARGVVPEEERARLARISLAGKPAPELDGAEWLNTAGMPMSLSNFKGKYVLLQFWTTWCGPCHQDMPTVRLFDELYRDRNIAVIGVHDNSMPLSAIKEDVARQKLTYPIVVDQADGRILAAYRAHGITGYPSYVLIGPDGLVIKDDVTMPGPSLRSFSIEIIRRLLLKEGNGR